MLSIDTILFPTDFSSCAEHAYSYAATLARQHEAALHVLHVMTPLEGDAYSLLRYTPESSVQHDNLETILQNMLADVGAGHDAEGVKMKRLRLNATSVAPKILAYARESDMDLVVMGTHGRRGVRSTMLGSVAEEVVRRAPCSVLTVRERAVSRARHLKRILVPVDFSRHSRRALRQAKHIAVKYGARLDVLHVIEPLPYPSSVTGVGSINDLLPSVKERSHKELRQLVEQVEGPDVKTTLYVDQGDAAETIAVFSSQHASDMVVLATHGLGGIERFLLGGVTERVMRETTSPVMIVKENSGRHERA